METLEKVIKFNKNKSLTRKKAIDLFTYSVENYKKAQQKDKLFWVAQTFINSYLVMKCDFLTGAQAFEVANNLATDFGADKDTLNKQIVKNLSKERGKNEKNLIISIFNRLICLCKRRGTK